MSTLLSKDLIGKQFKHYASNRIYTIVDIYQVKSLLTGNIISETYVTDNICAGQYVRGEIPWATIQRSVIRNGWVEAAA